MNKFISKCLMSGEYKLLVSEFGYMVLFTNITTVTPSMIECFVNNNGTDITINPSGAAFTFIMTGE